MSSGTYQGIPSTSISEYLPLTPPAFNDPAGHLDLARLSKDAFLPFERRSAAELRAAAFDQSTALERERALWALADSRDETAVDTILSFLRQEGDQSARSAALWLLMQTAGTAAVPHLEQFVTDDNPEVADWASVLIRDLTGRELTKVYTKAHVHEDRTFDQTVPLLIAGSVILSAPGLGMTRVVLSPQWFEMILGRVLACTRLETIETDLVIEKELKGLRADGSIHYEGFLFRGMSIPFGGRFYEHHYQSLMPREFFPSGTVEEGEPTLVPISAVRAALTEFSRKGEIRIFGEGERAERLRTAELPFVRSVRGRYSGWAAVNMDKVAARGTVAPGDVQLSNPTHPIAGPMTNAMLFGTFRGKAGDYSGRTGRLDLNGIHCHANLQGELDLTCGGFVTSGS